MTQHHPTRNGTRHRHISQNHSPISHRNDLKGHACFKSCNCPHLHLPCTEVHIATADTNITKAKHETHRIVPKNPFNYYTTSTILTESIIDHFNITAEQSSNAMLSRIIKAIQVVYSSQAPDVNTITQVTNILHSSKSTNLFGT